MEELGEQAIQKFELSGSTPERVVVDLCRIDRALDFFEHEGMIAELSQLHDHVAQPLHTELVALLFLVDEQYSMAHHLVVQFRLQRRELALDDLFNLVRQLRFDILLETTQQEGTKHFMKTTNDKQGFFISQLHLVLSTRIRERSVEPFIETLY